MAPFVHRIDASRNFDLSKSLGCFSRASAHDASMPASSAACDLRFAVEVKVTLMLASWMAFASSGGLIKSE